MRGLVIIPAYNEEGAILNTVRAIEEKAPSFDYLVINDCSTDSTRTILEENHLNHVNLPINSGIGAAVQTGYIYAWEKNYDCAVQMDGDGQHDPVYLEKMMKVMKDEKLDMVIGSRFIENKGFQSSKARRMGINFFKRWIRTLTGQTITDATSGMRLCDRNIIGLFAKDYPRDYPEPETVVEVIKLGYKVKEVPVVMKARETGKSSINPSKSIYYMVKVSFACFIQSLKKREVNK